MNQREIKRKMRKNGFTCIRQSNHLIFQHSVTGKLVTTPKSPRNNKFYSKVLDRQIKKTIGSVL